MCVRVCMCVCARAHACTHSSDSGGLLSSIFLMVSLKPLDLGHLRFCSKGQWPRLRGSKNGRRDTSASLALLLTSWLPSFQVMLCFFGAQQHSHYSAVMGVAVHAQHSPLESACLQPGTSSVSPTSCDGKSGLHSDIQALSPLTW